MIVTVVLKVYLLTNCSLSEQRPGVRFFKTERGMFMEISTKAIARKIKPMDMVNALTVMA